MRCSASWNPERESVFNIEARLIGSVNPLVDIFLCREGVRGREKKSDYLSSDSTYIRASVTIVQIGLAALRSQT